MSDLLSIEKLTKRFGSLVALDSVDFDVKEGEVHALLGENGAGKTTLMNAIFGLVRPDSGSMRFDGKSLAGTSPQSAMDCGIGMVHQHFKLVDEFTVAENIALGSPTSRDALSNKADSRLQKLLRETGFRVDPHSRIADIPVGVRQRVEILKALYRGAKLLILDEPTAVLTPQETDELFDALRRLRQAGTTIVIITHKLGEVMSLSDRVTILRAGKVVFRGDTSQLNEQRLASEMVGRSLSAEEVALPPVTDSVLLQMNDVSCRTSSSDSIHNISFGLYSGEILGFAGVEGNGQQLLADVISGIQLPDSGKLIFLDHEITTQSVAQRHAAGLSHIPGDRQRQALLLDFSLQENELLGRWSERRFDSWGFLKLRELKASTIRTIQGYGIRGAHTDTRAISLSGGNQQRFVIGRQLAGSPRVLLAINPTRGLDVGAIEYVHQQILGHCQSGGAVILISSDLDEALKLAHRIGVVYRGRIAEICRRPFDRDKIGLLMTTGESQ